MIRNKKAQLRRIIIKEELVALTGDDRLAAILNQFLYWESKHDDFDDFIREEKGRNPDVNMPLTEGWVTKSMPALKKDLMSSASPMTLNRCVSELITKGYLDRRSIPDNPFDKTLQYRVNMVKIQTDLQAMGYFLADYPALIEEPAKVDPMQAELAKLRLKNSQLEAENSRLRDEKPIAQNELSTIQTEVSEGQNELVVAQNEVRKGQNELPSPLTVAQNERCTSSKVFKATDLKEKSNNNNAHTPTHAHDGSGGKAVVVVPSLSETNNDFANPVTPPPTDKPVKVYSEDEKQKITLLTQLGIYINDRVEKIVRDELVTVGLIMQHQLYKKAHDNLRTGQIILWLEAHKEPPMSEMVGANGKVQQKAEAEKEMITELARNRVKHNPMPDEVPVINGNVKQSRLTMQAA